MEKKAAYGEEEIDLLELVALMWKKRKLIGVVVLIGTALSVMAVFIMPKKYTSTATLVPVEDKKTSPGLGALGALGIPVPTSAGEAKIKAVLESQSILERVVRELNLTQEILREDAGKLRYPDRVAAEVLKKSVKTSVTKDGVIKVSVNWTEPEKAKRINDSIIKNLREMLQEKSFTVAKMNRIFYEQELKKAEEELKAILADLGKFQKEEGVIMPEEQLRRQMQVYSSLMEQKLRNEAELRSMLSVFSDSHPRVSELRTRLAYINQKIAELEGSIKTNSGLSPDKPLSVIPEYTSLVAKSQQVRAKYEVLAKLLEQSRLEELRENLFVEIIDPPSYPEGPSFPKKKLIITAGFVSSLILGLFLALIIGTIEKRRSSSLQEWQSAQQ